MKKALTLILIVAAVGGVLWVSNGWTPRRTDPKAAKFNAVKKAQSLTNPRA